MLSNDQDSPKRNSDKQETSSATSDSVIALKKGASKWSHLGVLISRNPNSIQQRNESMQSSKLLNNLRSSSNGIYVDKHIYFSMMPN